MKVEQFPYMSPEATALRRRDGIPPWGVHPCEVDAMNPGPRDPLHGAWREAARLRNEIEAQADG